MPGHNISFDLEQAYRTGIVLLTDPGASATIGPLEQKGIAHVEIVTAAAESRALPSPTGLALGTVLYVFLKTAGGNLTITGGSPSSYVLTSAGDYAAWVVTSSGSSKVWRLRSSNKLANMLSGSKTVDIPIGNNWRAPTALITNLAGADSGSGSTAILGLETGAIGSAGNTLNLTTASNPSSVTASARDNTSFTLPFNYRSGTDVTIRVYCTETVTAGTSNQVDVIAVDSDDPTTDLCATAAQDIAGASNSSYDFTITGTNLVAGDHLDVRLSLFQNGTGTNVEHDIVKVQMIYTAG